MRGTVAGEAKWAHLTQQSALEGRLLPVSVSGEFHEGNHLTDGRPGMTNVVMAQYEEDCRKIAERESN